MRVIIAIACALCLSEFCIASKDGGPQQLEAGLKANPIDNDNSRRPSRSEASLQALNYIEGAEEAKLMQLLLGEESCVSCLAAWRLVQSDKKSGRRGADWFIGYLEGRYRVSVPDFWQEEIRQTRRGDGGAWLAPSPAVACSEDIRKEGHSIVVDKMTLYYARPGNIEAKGGKLVFRRKGFECSVDASDVADLGVREAQVCFSIDENSLIVALIEDSGSKYPIVAFATESGKLRWKSTVWGNLTADSGQFRFANFRHCLSLECADNTVRLFGTSGPAYCELYDASTGECQLRFSTIAWYAERYRKVRPKEPKE